MMEHASKIAILLLSPCFINGCFYERPFGYPAHIRQQGDAPCFAIENGRTTRRAPLGVLAVSVYRYGADRTLREGAVKEVWMRRYSYAEPPYKATSYFINPGQCILYNDDEKAPVLEAGEKYKVNINTYLGKMESGERRLFYGYFCLRKDQSGNVVVHQVEWDKRRGARNWDICH